MLFLADRTNGRAYGHAYTTVLRLSVSVSVTLCIADKRCVLKQKFILRAYRKSYMRNRLIMLGSVVKVSTFDDIGLVSAHLPLDFKYSADHSLILRFPLVTCTEETVYSK